MEFRLLGGLGKTVVCYRKRYPTLFAMKLREGWGTPAHPRYETLLSYCPVFFVNMFKLNDALCQVLHTDQQSGFGFYAEMKRLM